MTCTPLQFISLVEPVLEDALGKQVAFAQGPLCLNRVFQFHEGAAYLRLQRSLENEPQPELVATVAVRSVSGDGGAQAIQGECSHVLLKRTAPFFFTQPEEGRCKETLVSLLESLFEEAESLEKEQPQLEASNVEDSQETQKPAASNAKEAEDVAVATESSPS